MVFVSKARTSSGRVTTFGLPVRSTVDLRERITNALEQCKCAKHMLARPTVGCKYNLKRLRSNLAHAMSLDVCFQPLTGYFPTNGNKEEKTFQNNPLWDSAPQRAYYKTKKFCSLLQPIVTHGYAANIAGDLLRLSINIWRMPLRHFDGLCRRISSKISEHAKRDSPQKSEAEERFVALSSNPVLRNRVYWFSRNQARRWRRAVASLMRSTSVELVRLAQWRCHFASLRGKSLSRKG